MTVVSAGVTAFSYRRSVAPMMWVLVGIAAIELAVVHLLLSLWWPRVALAISACSFSAVAWLVAGIASFGSRPVMLTRDRLVMRTGWLKRLEVPIADIAAAGGERDRAALRALGAANFALVAHPNVVVVLRQPTRARGRTVGALAHRLDDAPAFLRALGSLRAGT